MDARKNIEAYLVSLPEWQRSNLLSFRELIHEVDPGITEDWKWSVPVFIKGGKLVCAMSTFKDHTKFNFFEGAALPDQHNLFNSGLDSKKHRSINLKEGEAVNADKLRDVIGAAIQYAKS